MLRGLMIFPRDFAEIVERRQMCRGGKIGEAQGVASKPAPLLGEMANIGQMIAQILMSGAHCLHVRGGAFRAETAVTPSPRPGSWSPRRGTSGGTNPPACALRRAPRRLPETAETHRRSRRSRRDIRRSHRPRRSARRYRSISTGNEPAGFSARNSARHSHGRSSASSTSIPHSASASRTEREKGQSG